MEYLETYWLISKYLGGWGFDLITNSLFHCIAITKHMLFCNIHGLQSFKCETFFGLPFGLGTS